MSMLSYSIGQQLETIPSDRTRSVVLAALKRWERKSLDVTQASFLSTPSLPQRIAAITEQAEREGRLDERARDRFTKGAANRPAPQRR